MAKATTPATTAAKPRRQSRSLEERLAELQSKVDAKQERTKKKASDQLAEVEDKLTKAHDTLIDLTTQRDSLRATLGLPAEVEDGDVTVDTTDAEV